MNNFEQDTSAIYQENQFDQPKTSKSDHFVTSSDQ